MFDIQIKYSKLEDQAARRLSLAFDDKEFDITGRPMKGWLLVEPKGVEGDDQLAGWIQRAVIFVKVLPAK